jgi:triacylglycerol esterase/lipase EstA (alpha/beta hydrolase family)
MHLRAWWGEAITAIKVFHWWQPFRRASIPDGTDAASVSSGQRGVVLVHGFFCNRAFWTHWMRRLQAQQRPFIAVDLAPAFGSIDAYVATINHAVQQMKEATGQSPVIVGHSMGGLAIRAWLASLHTQDAGNAAVRRVITLGSPHDGTWLAKFALTRNGAQMQHDSLWLRTLQSSEKVLKSVNFVCFYSNCDNIVFPSSYAKLEGADNRLVHGLGHIDMAHDPAVMDVCWDLMQ